MSGGWQPERMRALSGRQTAVLIGIIVLIAIAALVIVFIELS